MTALGVGILEREVAKQYRLVSQTQVSSQTVSFGFTNTGQFLPSQQGPGETQPQGTAIGTLNVPRVRVA